MIKLAAILAAAILFIVFGVKAISQLAASWEESILEPKTNKKKPKKRKKRDANK